MTPAPTAVKTKLRRELRARLAAITPALRQTLSARARELLILQKEWRQARSVLLYATLPDEIDLGPLLSSALAEGKVIGLPRFAADQAVYHAARVVDPERDVVTGQFGILEPASHCEPLPLNKLDLALVPGLGFDEAGRRLGRGKGYYDRLLAQVAGIRCGVGFDEQICQSIPIEKHDVVLNRILTPTRWLETLERVLS